MAKRGRKPTNDALDWAIRAARMYVLVNEKAAAKRKELKRDFYPIRDAQKLVAVDEGGGTTHRLVRKLYEMHARTIREMAEAERDGELQDIDRRQRIAELDAAKRDT
jgi:hypothetical protein